MKHRLAEERATKRDTIKSAHKFAIFPGFHCVRKPRVMELGVSVINLFGNPGGFSRVGALGDYLRPSGIEVDLKWLLPHCASQSLRYVNPVQIENTARIARVPSDVAEVVAHGKNARGIAPEHDFRRKTSESQAGFFWAFLVG